METSNTSSDAPAVDALELNDAEQVVESAAETLEKIQSLAEEQSDDTLREIQSMLNRHQEMMERRFEAMGGNREAISGARQDRRQGFDELIGQIDSALSQPIEGAPTGPIPEIHESSLTPEARMGKSREETMAPLSSDSELEENPEDSMNVDGETKLSEDPSPEIDAAAEPQTMETEMPSVPEESTERENEPVIEHSDEDIERMVAQALEEPGSGPAKTDPPPEAAESTSSETSHESLSDEALDEELSRILSQALDEDAPAEAPVPSDEASVVESNATPLASTSTDDLEEGADETGLITQEAIGDERNIDSPDVASPTAFEVSEDIDQDLSDLLESVLASTAVQSQSNDECTGPATSEVIMPLLDEDDPEFQEITADLQNLLDLAFSDESPADDHAAPSTVDADAQVMPPERSAEGTESAEPSVATMPIETIETEATEEHQEETPPAEAASAFPDEATVSTVCDQIFSQLDAELNDSVASMMDTDMAAIEAVLDSIFDEQAMFVEDEEDSALLSNDMACDDTGGAVRPMPESLKGTSDTEASVPMDDSGETSPTVKDSTDELAGSLDEAVSAVSSEIEQELVKKSKSSAPVPASESVPATPVESGNPLGKLWKKAEPPLVTVLSLVNWPLRKVPENARFMVDWFSLSLVFWVPVVWVLVMFVAGK